MTDPEVPADLLLRCRNGEDAAWEHLFRLFQVPVRRHLLFVLGTDEDIEDLVQMTFVQVARSLRAYRGEASLKGWILGVARNVAREHQRDRKQSDRNRREESEWSWMFERPADEPSRDCEGREMARVVLRVLETLSGPYRDVWTLCEMEGMNSQEVGEALGIPAGTVRSRLHHAREQVLQALRRSGMIEGGGASGSRILPFERRRVARDTGGEDPGG